MNKTYDELELKYKGDFKIIEDFINSKDFEQVEDFISTPYIQTINYLQQRIDKAIEYIEDNKSYTTIEKFVRMNTFEKVNEDILTEEMIKDLLKILRGDINGK